LAIVASEGGEGGRRTKKKKKKTGKRRRENFGEKQSFVCFFFAENHATFRHASHATHTHIFD
jgi:hypothetical protein